MGILIGMDEAGYGPNLGPLVVTVTAWDVPGAPGDADPWTAFSKVLTATPERGDARLHVGDSKQVYSPGKGIASLERSVLTALRLAGAAPTGFRELCGLLATGPRDDVDPHEPWFADGDRVLPAECCPIDCDGRHQSWRAACEASGIRLRAIRSDVVFTPRFNRLTTDADSKGIALSRISLRLLRSVWDPEASGATLIIADKHGGRNRYDTLLQEVLDGQMVFRREEGPERSEYSIGQTRVRFQTKAEQHFPVAVASMVSKYVREMAMDVFNAWWQQHVPGVKPTKGYPDDARRFRKDIAKQQKKLGVADHVLWRER